jgi:flavodoxin
MKSLVVYYSHTGSNRYLAERIARELNADIEAIRPRSDLQAFLLVSSWTGLSRGIKPLEHDISEYDQLILCGPIWTGQLISPLKSFCKSYDAQIDKIHFATCCGSTDQMKDEKFGYGAVFKKVKKLMGSTDMICEAFPIPLVLPEEDRGNDELIMKTRLSDDNFVGEIKERFDGFIRKIRAEQMVVG